MVWKVVLVFCYGVKFLMFIYWVVYNVVFMWKCM